jgi:hypothetical protein
MYHMCNPWKAGVAIWIQASVSALAFHHPLCRTLTHPPTCTLEHMQVIVMVALALANCIAAFVYSKVQQRKKEERKKKKKSQEKSG